MTKVVYNGCFGGFNLSDGAVLWLEKHGSQEVKDFLAKERAELENQSPEDRCGTIESSMAFRLMYCFKNDEGMPRHHPDLVRVVEVLGDEASGMCSELQIAEIQGKLYRIDEYDGNESVVEPNDYEWVVVE